MIVNMVVSVDGSSSSGGKASGIGGEADRAAMRALRSKVDAVMVGAGTLRAERLNLGLDDPDADQPLAVIVGGSGPAPIPDRLVRSPRQRILLFRPAAAGPRQPEELPNIRTVCVDARSDGRTDLRSCLGHLRRDHGVGRLLVEGGPTLNGALLEEGLADEIFLTLAPKLLLSSPTPFIQAPTPGPPRDLDLISVHTQNGELFLRYRPR